MVKLMKYAVGIDVSKDKFDVCFCEINTVQQINIKSSGRFCNTDKKFKEFDLWLGKNQKEKIPLILMMEATGVYYDKIALYLYKKGYSVSVVLPTKAKKYMQALGLKSKNDKIDAKGLARMAAEQKHDLWQPMGDYFYKLRQLTRYHEQLQQSKTHFANQIHALEHGSFQVKEVVRHQRKMILLIEKQIVETLKFIKEHVNSSEEVKQKVDNICLIKGIGLLTVATIIGETNGFEMFENIRQLVSYSGYDVVENQSGKHFGKTKISKKGNAHIRRILHMPSFTVVRYDQKPFADLFERVYERTNIKMKGYVAVQKKMLIYIYTLWKNNQPYQPRVNNISGNDESKSLFLLVSEGNIIDSKKK